MLLDASTSNSWHPISGPWPEIPQGLWHCLTGPSVCLGDGHSMRPDCFCAAAWLSSASACESALTAGSEPHPEAQSALSRGMLPPKSHRECRSPAKPPGSSKPAALVSGGPTCQHMPW